MGFLLNLHWLVDLQNHFSPTSFQPCYRWLHSSTTADNQTFSPSFVHSCALHIPSEKAGFRCAHKIPWISSGLGCCAASAQASTAVRCLLPNISEIRNYVECVARDCNCQITFVHISSQTLFRCHSQLVWSHCPTFRERVIFAIFLAKAIFYIYCQFYYPSPRQSYSAEKSFGPSAVQFAASLLNFPNFEQETDIWSGERNRRWSLDQGLTVVNDAICSISLL